MEVVSEKEEKQLIVDPPEGQRSASCWRRFADKWFRMKYLILWTMLGVVVGIGLGGGLYGVKMSRQTVTLIGYPGELMIRVLQELILPLMIFSLMSGVLSLRSTKTGSGQVTKWAVYYYTFSMILAIGIGLGMVYAIKPGKSRPFGDSKPGECGKENESLLNTTVSSSSGTGHSTVDSLLQIGRDLIPTNIVSAAAQPNYLGVMLFSIMVAFVLNTFGERSEGLINVIELINKVIIRIVRMVIVATPVGVASLIASTILQACNLGHLLQSLGEYLLTIIGGFAIHVFIGLPITLLVFSGSNPFRAFKSFLPAFAMGFGTSSSAATMPVTMQCAEEHGCLSSIVKFVIPFGTNVNRDGTALYEAVSVIFIAQAHGVNLSASNVVIIAITATLAAIGSASVPHAGLVTLITVVQAVGLSEYLNDLSVLFAVDWLLSLLRTVVNIWGDGCAVIVLDAWVKKQLGNEETLPVRVIPSTTETQIHQINRIDS